MTASRIEMTLLRVESRRHALQAHEAADQQPGADQQHQRERHLRTTSRLRSRRRARAEAAFALRAPAARLERRVEVHSRRAQRRRQAEDDAGQDRHART